MKGIKVLKSSIFKDHRGYLWTSWEKKKIKLKFNHDKFSVSKKNVLRGLHGDSKTWKLVSCVFGKVFFVVVNNDKKSKEYLKKKTFILNHNKNTQILIPPKFVNGFLCLSDKCVFHYKLSYTGKYFDVKDQMVVKWNDKRLKIKWPTKKNLLFSKRDK
jgi:dTDP-4-dehydrorhamnose 3,5-epimerase